MNGHFIGMRLPILGREDNFAAKKDMRHCVFIVFLFYVWSMSAQGYVSYDHFSSSTLRDDAGNRFGAGSMSMMSVGYGVPLSRNVDDMGKAVMWTAAFGCDYAVLDNMGQASQMNPDEVVNAGINVTHVRPISAKWNLLATVGTGMYAPVNEISSKSWLFNGGVVFICDCNRNISLGIGGGVTNSFGVPMAMPMLYLSWRKKGQFEFHIDMSSKIKISALTNVWRNLTVELSALDIDGLTAVMKIDGREQIYSMMMLNSYIKPSYAFSPKCSVFAVVGGCWIRGISVTERSLKGFFNGFKDDNDDPYFQAALRLSAGVRFSF